MSIPSDQASRLGDHASNTADDAVRSTQRAIHSGLNSVAGKAQDLRREAGPILDRAASLARQGRDAVADGTRQLRDQARYASYRTTDYIQHAPVKSVLIAAAAGAALLALMSLLNNRRHY